jgi:L,D-transpeptidase catalytic domain
MAYMERVTWGGVALHAGQLPGYPASHGCVRLPMDFAEKLYTVTQKGTTVIGPMIDPHLVKRFILACFFLRLRDKRTLLRLRPMATSGGRS